MDMSDNDNLELEKRNEEESLRYHPTEWRYNGANFTNSSIESFGQSGWQHPMNTPPLGFSEMNVQDVPSTSDPLSILKGGLFLSNMSGLLPHSLSQFPADSAFIERAARFSSFNGGQCGDLLNPFGVHQSSNPYLSGHPQKIEANIAETSKDVTLPQEHRTVEGSPPKETRVERSHDDAKEGVSVSGNETDDAELSGGATQEVGAPSLAKRFALKKRKRRNEDAEPEQANGVQQQSGEAGKNNTEIRQKGEQNSTPTRDNSNGKQGKQSSQNSDPPKEEYIHVRARRGQATNSHSLAERVRREKISERMKFLQDLVPGCSKVTGKAVMLDEIINYVQSLQRQVEFLSMKLATVNPRLDFNIERLLAKDIFSVRGGPSPGLGFSTDMPVAYPPLHPSQPPFLPPGLLGIGNSSDALRRSITSQLTNMGGGYKEPTSQLPNVWEDELHNVVQMGFNASAPVDNQENDCNLPPCQMKAEP